MADVTWEELARIRYVAVTDNCPKCGKLDGMDVPFVWHLVYDMDDKPTGAMTMGVPERRWAHECSGE